MNIGEETHRILIRRVYAIGVMLLMAMFLAVPLTVHADGFDYNAWLTAEQAKYPAGKY